MTGVGIAGAGLLAGALHVYLGPDHLAALAVMSFKAPARAWRLGLRWGLGHTGGVLAVAALVFSVRGFLDVEKLSKTGEALVGVTLLALGLWGLLKSRHPRNSDDPPGHGHGRAAFLVGILHGAAGTSHVLGVLPGLALPTTALALIYLASFSLATILAMAAYSGLLGRMGRRTPADSSSRVSWLLRIASAVSILVGVAWIVFPKIGIPLS